MARTLIGSSSGSWVDAGRARAWGLGFGALWALTGVPACGSQGPSDPDETGGAAGGAAAAGGNGAGTAGTAGGSAGSGGSTPAACDSVFEQHPPASASHLAPCSVVSYESNPPSGGNHYDVWAAFQSYDFAVPAGFLVHALEHGAVVFWYNCPEGCADEVAQASAMIESFPLDPLCAGTSTSRRAVLVPSPELDARWAASAWGFLVKADCFDEGTLRSFYADHYAQGRENFCTPSGTTLTASTCP
ncbi:MAG: DUF3105 domain-containing protein [Deltaproteobacteria bacterium]